MSEYEKPSRQQRRQKRGWQRRPKKALDQCRMPWQSPPVSETEGNGFSSPKDKGGCSASMADFLRPSHVLPSQWRAVRGSLRACRFLCPGLLTLHAPATHLAVGSGIETADKGLHAMRKAALGKLAHNIFPASSMTRYRVFRCFFGPLFAYRLVFAGRAA